MLLLVSKRLCMYWGHWRSYRESVTRLANGCASDPCPPLPESKSQISSLVSSEKSASTAPARVPVATSGFAIPFDQAKAAVRGISRTRPIVRQGLQRDRDKYFTQKVPAQGTKWGQGLKSLYI